MQSKQEVLDRIKADPEGTLADIEKLGKELIVERMLSKSRDQMCKYFSFQAELWWKKYHEARRALIRARILVQELKKAYNDQSPPQIKSDSE